MGDYETRIRIVTLGGAGVGKSAIVKRFLFNSFSEKYKPTVEELYNQEYDFGAVTLKVDILDTAGDLQFPAMRRLSIATAHAFLIAYSVQDRDTFELVKGLFDEIQEQRADFEEIPIIVAANKIDVANREIPYEEVCDWLDASWPNLSAHAGTKSPVVPRSPCSASAGFFGSSSPPQSMIPTSSRAGGTPPKNPSSPSYQQFLTEESAFQLGKQKPRSRSLMRRSSKKVKNIVRDASGGPDCQIT